MFDNLINNPSESSGELDFSKYKLPDLSGYKIEDSNEIIRVADLLNAIPNGQHFGVFFIKRTTGEPRQLNCIKGIQFIPTSNIASPPPYHAGARNLFTVFHIDEDPGPRHIPMDRVLCIQTESDGEEKDHFHTSLYERNINTILNHTFLRSANAALEELEESITDPLSKHMLLRAIRRKVADQVGF